MAPSTRTRSGPCMWTWRSTMAFRSFHFFSKESLQRLTSTKLTVSIRLELAMRSSFRMLGRSSNPFSRSNYLINYNNNCVDKFLVMEYKHITDQLGLRLLRSEEHTSELQSRGHLVCRLLLEKKK